VRCYRGALELQPDDPQVLCNLGNALRQLGQLQEAFACTRRALALAPGLSMAHNNLGLLYAATGERAQALGCYREALRLSPGYVDALNNLGTALKAQGERREALAVYRQAVELEPRRADSHCNLGYALLDSRRTAEALVSFRNALAAQPGSVPAHLGLAAAQRVQGEFAPAEASAQAALALAPSSPEVLALLGELRADRGQFGEAQELFERALAADPQFASAYGSIAAHRRMSRDDAAWLKGAEELLRRQLPLDQEIHLRYALGKYFDDTGQYDQAFSHYQQANELSKRHGAGYDGARLTHLVDRIIAFCDAGFVRQERPGACASALPVFIIGMPRSGTTLVEQILASHPQVFGAGEVRFWDRAFANLEQLGRDGDPPRRRWRRWGGTTSSRWARRRGRQCGSRTKCPRTFCTPG
jgi:tetratricopeptide (TPR) repeat protein